MASVTEYFEKLQKLTQRNLDILQAINDAFYSNKSHLLVNIGDEQYTIPSFMHLENKLNALQDGFNNLVYAPKTGEASFNFDGNSQTIELRGFTCTPQSVELKSPVVNFNVENNHIFKDFLTPNPFVKFDLSSIPNDISKVCIKKVVAISQEMKEEFRALVETNSSRPISYDELYKKLSLYELNKDYIEYENTKDLPIRKSIGTGLYIIKSIDDHKILDDLTEVYTLTISNELKYTLFDNTIEKYLQQGDELVTFDDSAKLRIREILHNTNQLEVEVMNGDYLNLVADAGDDSLASDMSKLKFFSPIDSSKDKYINVSLEEDQYIAIFVSPLNNRMNIRAPWGKGVVINTYNLQDINGNKYKEFYDENINNIGDILYELTTMSANGITKYNNDEFDTFSKHKPVLNPNDLHVYQINTHLNNSPTIQKIRSLYNQKVQYNNELSSVQQNIDSVNSTLSSISFDDTTNIRIVYENQLIELNKKRNELISSINKVMNEISIAANNSDTPIENAKFRIRGFYNISNENLIDKYKEHINGIRVWYKYKNQNQETGNAHSVGSEYIFSDWNEMPIIKRMRNPRLDNSKYTYNYSADTSSINEPSFNQIDIPITQGETVDIKLQIIWDFGFPFIETTSSWSDMISIVFPEELKKNVQILDIIKENNSEIENYRFTNILTDNGITKHVNDKLIDQDLTYFHQPEHVSSGFYTAERRVIPLKDKLLSIDSDINTLKDEVFGNDVNNLKITTVISNIITPILPNQENVVYLVDGVSTFSLQLKNNSNRNIKLYSILPGSRDTVIYNKGKDIYNPYENYEVRIIEAGNYMAPRHQTLNQYIYFRSVDAWTQESIDRSNIKPLIRDKYQLCLNSDSKFDYLELKPNESVVIPLKKIDNYSIDTNIMQFSLRMSLYDDPVSYEIKFTEDSSSLMSQIQTTQIDYNTVVK